MLDAGSVHVMLDVQPDGSVEFMTRQAANGETTFIGGLPAATHQWFLRLVRTNGVVTGYACYNGTCQTVGSAPFVDGFAFVGAVVTSHVYGVVNHVTINSPSVITVPRPFFSWDFNASAIGIPGTAFFQHDTFIVQGAGTDIWGTADSYHEVSGTMSGDGTITARVTREDAANTFAKAGVITRNGNQTVILDVRPNGLIEFMARPIQGGTMQFIAGASASFPVWLKIQRVGDQFTGSISNDGANWQPIGTATVATYVDVAAGLAVTSHDPNMLNTSTFDHVVLSSGPTYDVDIGDTGAAGSVVLTGNGFTVSGSGADIWGTQDAFNLFYEGLNGDGQMQIRVTQLDNTDPFAKAGIMVRASTDPSAPFVIADVRPDGNLEFMQRSSTGAETTFLATTHVTFPVTFWVWRVGTTINAGYSLDGQSRSHLGTTTADLPVEALIGVAVTSHRRGVLASATFDNFGR
jgi:hypothetical protein